MKYYLLFFLLYAAVLSGQEVNISNAPIWGDNEPNLAINPNNANNIVVAWIKFPFIVTKASLDGGKNWTALKTISPITFQSMADPALAFHGDTVYLCYVDYNVLTLDSGAIFMVKSEDMGQSWGIPTLVIGSWIKPDMPIDRPWLAIDNSGGPRDGWLYLGTMSAYFYGGAHHVWLSVSENGGMSWNPILMIDDSISVGLLPISSLQPVIASNGMLYMTYASWDLTKNLVPQFVCSRSNDGGINRSVFPIAQAVSGSAISDSLYQPSVNLAVNPINSNNLVFIATDARFGDPDILAVSTMDGGQSWSIEQRINDDAMANGIGQDMCWATFTDDGKYLAAWRDRRGYDTTSASDFNVFGCVSFDGGSTFSPNVKITNSPSPGILIERGNDFIGLGASSSTVHYVWADRRDGNNEIYYTNDTSIVLNILKRPGKKMIQVYPNPTSGKLNFTIKDYHDCYLYIYDIQGTLLDRSRIQQVEFNLTYPSGIYFYAVNRGENMRAWGKFIIE